jgi:hypothetical protein
MWANFNNWGLKRKTREKEKGKKYLEKHCPNSSQKLRDCLTQEEEYLFLQKN